jgi:GT2 family glycosyltransferase
MITYNRLEETRQTVESLYNSSSIADVDFHILDNGSTEIGMLDYLRSLTNVNLHLQDKNIGCPKGLNLILSLRQPSQHFIKIDNDVKVTTQDWLDKWLTLISEEEDVVLIGGYYKKAFYYERFKEWRQTKSGSRWAFVYPIMGRFMFHRGSFMDKVGYFDVLAENHVYGYEDLLICLKAQSMGKFTAVLPSVEIKHLQMIDSYAEFDGKSKSEHLVDMDAYYKNRVQAIIEGNFFTDVNGSIKFKI